MKNQSKKENNRTLLWTIFGILLGFSLPVILCAGLFFALTIGFGTIIGQGGSINTPTVPIQVSGPLTGPAIAIIEVKGQIVSGEASIISASTYSNSDNLIRQIYFAKEDSDVKAVLLKVNSPGGSVVASDEIYHQLKNLDKPIVVIMDEIAASGGYYISMAADYIFANPNSLVGSVGVISTIPTAEDLIEKIGVEFNVFTSGESKDFGSLYRSMTDEEKAYWQNILDESYENFLQIVAEGRDLSIENVKIFSDGKVFTGQQAIKLGMVDEIGYQENAIKKAAILASIPGEPRIIKYPSGTGFLSLLQETVRPIQPSSAQKAIEQLLTPGIYYYWSP